MKKKFLATLLAAASSMIPISALADNSAKDAEIQVWVIGILIALILIFGLVVHFVSKSAENKNRARAMEISRSGGSTLLIEGFDLGHQEWNSGNWYFVHDHKPDIRGGWGIDISIRNSLTKDIKYCEFFFTALNSVGDSAYCSGKYKASVSVKGTGPVRVGEMKEWQFHPIWHSEDIQKVRLNSIAVEFMDGTNTKVNCNMTTK